MVWVIVSIFMILGCSDPDYFYHSIKVFDSGNSIIEVEVARGHFSNSYLYGTLIKDQFKIIGKVKLRNKPYTYLRKISVSDDKVIICALNEPNIETFGDRIVLKHFKDIYEYNKCQGKELSFIKPSRIKSSIEKQLLEVHYMNSNYFE